MKRSTLAILTAPIAALALTACGTDNEPAETKTVTQTATPNAEAADVPEDELTDADAEPEDYDESDAQDVMVTFGEEYEWLDGTKVTISEPEPYQPDEFAAGGETSNEIVSVDVTITNGQDAPLDASYVTPTVTSAGTPGDEVFDDTVGFGAEMSVMPGKSVTFKAAYGVDDSDDMVVEFAPTWDHRNAYWTTEGAK